MPPTCCMRARRCVVLLCACVCVCMYMQRRSAMSCHATLRYAALLLTVFCVYWKEEIIKARSVSTAWHVACPPKGKLDARFVFLFPSVHQALPAVFRGDRRGGYRGVGIGAWAPNVGLGWVERGGPRDKGDGRRARGRVGGGRQRRRRRRHWTAGGRVAGRFVCSWASWTTTGRSGIRQRNAHAVRGDAGFASSAPGAALAPSGPGLCLAQASLRSL